MIFGVKQCIDNDEGRYSCAIYPRETYEQKTNLQKLLTMQNKDEMLLNIQHDKLHMLCFGQTPFQLFDTEHERLHRKFYDFSFSNGNITRSERRILLKNEPFYFINNLDKTNGHYYTSSKKIKMHK